MYVLTDKRNYIGVGSNNNQTTVKNIKKALTFSEEQKAINYLDNLKTTLRKFNWQVKKINDDTVEEKKKEHEVAQENFDYIETSLERDGFDISDFFKTTIETISQLKDYSSNMRFKEEEYNKKIKDVRHYKRDIDTKLSAVQLQRLEQFEIQLERERYECKSNRIIAEIFLTDLNRLENINYIEAVRNVKESEYKPEILTYELLDEIVGKKTKKIKEC